ncbi:MAG TPA: hypothetical protein VFQ73_09080 [Flavisolibacter sp.]|nr:hypothetical protein [Flavisolibacter sp.]
MDISIISLVLSIMALLVAAFVFFQLKDNSGKDGYSTRPLQLQAYERLVLLCERIAMPNLISRLSQPGLSAREMQVYLIETIKQEYEYNASQQIYVSQKAWEAVRNLRDQNMLMINTIAKTLTPDATANELNRQLIEGLMHEEKAALHTFVADTLNAEAKKIM